MVEGQLYSPSAEFQRHSPFRISWFPWQRSNRSAWEDRSLLVQNSHEIAEGIETHFETILFQSKFDLISFFHREDSLADSQQNDSRSIQYLNSWTRDYLLPFGSL